MKLGVVWNVTDVETPVGVRIVVNPRCRTVLHDGSRCGLLASLRVTNPGCWSMFVCPVHYHPLAADDGWWARYWRLFPDALERAFIDRLQKAWA